MILEQLILRLLALMKRPDTLCRKVQRLNLLRRTRLARSRNLGICDAHADLGEIDRVKFQGILGKSRITPRSNIPDDRMDNAVNIL